MGDIKKILRIKEQLQNNGDILNAKILDLLIKKIKLTLI